MLDQSRCTNFPWSSEKRFIWFWVFPIRARHASNLSLWKMTLCLLKSEMFVSFTMIQTIQRDLCTDAARVVFPLRIKCITYIETLSKPIRALVPVCGHNLSVFPIILSGLWSHPSALPHAGVHLPVLPALTFLCPDLLVRTCTSWAKPQSSVIFLWLARPDSL